MNLISHYTNLYDALMYMIQHAYTCILYMYTVGKSGGNDLVIIHVHVALSSCVLTGTKKVIN